MIERFWISNYRMLAASRVDLRPFMALVGRNGTGKTTFLAALRFIADLLEADVDAAVSGALGAAGSSFDDLCFDPAKPLTFALQLRVNDRRFRYELEVGSRSATEPKIVVRREALYVIGDAEAEAAQASLFGDLFDEPIVHADAPKGWREVASKTADGKDYFQDERTTWNNVFRFGPSKSSLGHLPEDPERFPGAMAVRKFLREGLRVIDLDTRALRLPSPPRSPTKLFSNGSNLAAAVHALHERDPVLFDQWVKNAARALDGLESIDTWDRPEDRHRVLRATFRGSHGEPVPSWGLSDGTLRLLALTLLAYAEEPDSQEILLIEEPENGLHPLAIQCVYDALHPMDRSQVFVTSHSPIFLAAAALDDVLVFRREESGRARIVRGPELAEAEAWHGRVAVDDLFASGVLS